MHRITRRFAVVAAVVLVVLGTAVGASAATVLHFGYHKVRVGLPTGIKHFKLTSTDIRAGKPIPARFWGCADAGISPQLSWSGAPAGTQSFAIQLFDKDAPTGSGFCTGSPGTSPPRRRRWRPGRCRRRRRSAA